MRSAPFSLLMRPGLAALLLALLLACTPAAPPGAPEAPSPSSAATTTATSPSPGSTTTTPPAQLPLAPSGSRAYAHVQALAGEIGSRPLGTQAVEAATGYLEEQWRAQGYYVERQPFLASYFDDRSALSMEGPETREFQVLSLLHSAEGTTSAPLADAGRGYEREIPADGLAGRIALLERGEITFEEKVARVAEAGALAALIFNNRPGLFGGDLRQESAIPAVALSQEDGRALRQALARGPVAVRVTVETETVEAAARNVIARSGPGRPCRYLVGGHYDSVAEGPGANDNASGVAVALEVSRLLSEQARSLFLCFAAFDAEEVGLFGSRHFAEGLSPKQREGMAAMINLDMVGVGTEWKAIGSSSLANLLVEVGEEMSITVTPFSLPRGTSSDHASFLQVGIPAVFLHRLDDPHYHTAQDVAAFVEPQALEDAARLVAALLLRLEEGE